MQGVVQIAQDQKSRKRRKKNPGGSNLGPLLDVSTVLMRYMSRFLLFLAGAVSTSICGSKDDCKTKFLPIYLQAARVLGERHTSPSTSLACQATHTIGELILCDCEIRKMHHRQCSIDPDEVCTSLALLQCSNASLQRHALLRYHIMLRQSQYCLSHLPNDCRTHDDRYLTLRAAPFCTTRSILDGSTGAQKGI